MLADRGVEVDHTTLYRWVQRFAPELEKRLRRHLSPCRGSWHVDETYVRVGGAWRYLYRAVDGSGQTIDFMLSAKRDEKAARRSFRRALGRANTRNPRTVITDRLNTNLLWICPICCPAMWLTLLGNAVMACPV